MAGKTPWDKTPHPLLYPLGMNGVREEFIIAWRACFAVYQAVLPHRARGFWLQLERRVEDGLPMEEAARSLQEAQGLDGATLPLLHPKEEGFDLELPPAGPYAFRLKVFDRRQRLLEVDMRRGRALLSPGALAFPSLSGEGDFDLLAANRLDVYYYPLVRWALGEEATVLGELLAGGKEPAFPGEALRIRHEALVPLEGWTDLVVYETLGGGCRRMAFPNRKALSAFLFEATHSCSPLHPILRFPLAVPLRLWAEGHLGGEELQEIVAGVRHLSHRFLQGYMQAAHLMPPGEERTLPLPDGRRVRLRHKYLRLLGGRPFIPLPPGQGAEVPPPEEAPWAMAAYWDGLALEVDIPMVDVHALVPVPLQVAGGTLYYTPKWALWVKEEGAGGGTPLRGRPSSSRHGWR